MKIKYIILILIILTQILLASEKKKIGLVLSGGAAKGFAHIGVLKVLEREGIIPDYITGTSMGAIIGALYASGYSAEEIENIILSQDWEKTFNDELTRDQLNILDKKSVDQYFFTLPIYKLKVNLPQGLIRGQKIYNMLAKYTAQHHHINNFSELPIPFMCIATDIQTGQYIKLNSGYLPEALRASMAMPTIFTPVKIDGRILVDGGLVHNFPVQEVIEMGADLIIGSDVQDPLLENTQLNSISNILYQSIKFLRIPKYEESISLCNLLIKPEVHDLGAEEFSKADKFIYRGEYAAEKVLEEIKKIQIVQNKKIRPNTEIIKNKIKINVIKFSGLKDLTYNYVIAMLGINEGNYYTIDEINEAINRTYASGFFELVYYKLLPQEKGYKLIVESIEKNYNELNIGIHYNSDFNSAILFQLNFDNLFYQGTKLSADLALGENPRAVVDYSIFTSWKSRYYARTELNNFDIFTYSGDRLTSSFSLTNLLLDIGVERQLRDNMSLGGSAKFEFATLGEIVDPLKLEKYDNFFFVLRTYINHDTYDRIYFPSKGIMWNLEIRKVWDFSSGNLENKSVKKFNAEMLYGRYAQAIRYNKKLTFIPSFYGGVTFGRKDIPLTYRFYLGGLSSVYIKGIYPFVGMNFMQKTGDKLWVARLDTQYEVLRNLFVTLKTNFGETFFDVNEIYDQYGLNWGIGLSLGYASIVGPIEIDYMWGTEIRGAISYIRIGVGM